jgi:2-C-methyl-D-erythritol 2,4-cyclodiphosphate synthase
MFKVGFAYDSHRFVKNRKLFLGGVEIQSDYGLKGHSDADVLIHALIDAILGAMGKGDIGQHFPDTDIEFKDISSLILLEKVFELMEKEHYIINNADLILMAEKPKINPYREKILKNISNKLNTEIDQINFKATTTEQLGFIGQSKGIAAQAVVTLIELV